MGAWGPGNFENDDALDWVAELQEADGIAPLTEALQLMVDPGREYLEAPDCCFALAAAEVVAALKQARALDLPDSVQEWINNHQQLYKAELTRTALQAVERIRTDSELKDLWDESDNPTEWYAVVDNLAARLRQ